jgi:AraC-like DNA-binding protein
MLEPDHIEFLPGGREENLGDRSPEWPFSVSHVDLWRYPSGACPMHWHKDCELFYVAKGELECRTLREARVFAEGSMGYVNCGELHCTAATAEGAEQYIYLFDPVILEDALGAVANDCVRPVSGSKQVSMLSWNPDDDEDAAFIAEFLRSIDPSSKMRGALQRMHLRNILGELWIGIYKKALPVLASDPACQPTFQDVRLKKMLEYIRGHYSERIGVADIAAAANASERECYRDFKDLLGMSPARYLREYRVSESCRLLAHTTRPIAAVAGLCGFTDASGFGQVFKAQTGLTPSQYRESWQKIKSAGREFN